MFTFETSVLRITRRKLLKDSGKLSKDVKTAQEPIHRTLSTQGLIIFKETPYTFYFFFLHTLTWYRLLYVI